MKNSPLRLERSFFTKVSVLAHPDGKPDGKWDIETTPEVSRQDEGKKWAVSLRVCVKQIGDVRPPYQAEVEAVGWFSVEDSWPKERVEQLVHANGCALLYSAVREMICNTTSRGPWPMLLIPSVSFVDSAPKPTKEKTLPKND